MVAITTNVVELITAAALDYADGWYQGDAARMERCLHPDLAKRAIFKTPQGQSRLDQMSALTLVKGARAGWGVNTPLDQHVKEVTVLDIYHNIATVKLVMRDWVDYLHIGRFNDEWVIINVLWELNPQEGQ